MACSRCIIIDKSLEILFLVERKDRMKWFKRVMAFFLIGLATVVLSGCGKDLSGTYMAGEPADGAVRVLEVAKGDKDGYLIKYYWWGYDTSKKWGPGTVSPNPFNPAGKYIDNLIFTATYSERLQNTLITSAPSKSNKMTFSNQKTLSKGIIGIDEEGNLIDETGFTYELSGELGTKYKKVTKTINKEEMKKEMQEAVATRLHKNYDFDKGNRHSEVKEIIFKDDEKTKK